MKLPRRRPPFFKRMQISREDEMQYSRLSFRVRTFGIQLFLLFTMIGAAPIHNWEGVGAASARSAAPGGEPNIAWEQQGHSNRVTSVPFSPNGQLVASAGDDQSIKVWQTSNGALLRAFKVRFGGATSVAFSPDGQTLAVGTAAVNQNLYFFHIADGSLV